jgi:transcriptional regulator with XRE-family HTH domain
MPDDNHLRVIRLRTRKARLKRGMSQEEAANGAELSLRIYQRFEAQRVAQAFNPTFDGLRRVARTVGIPLSELVAEPTTAEIKELETFPTAKRPKRSKTT